MFLFDAVIYTRISNINTAYAAKQTLKGIGEHELWVNANVEDTTEWFIVCSQFDPTGCWSQEKFIPGDMFT